MTGAHFTMDSVLDCYCTGQYFIMDFCIGIPAIAHFSIDSYWKTLLRFRFIIHTFWCTVAWRLTLLRLYIVIIIMAQITFCCKLWLILDQNRTGVHFIVDSKLDRNTIYSSVCYRLLFGKWDLLLHTPLHNIHFI